MTRLDSPSWIKTKAIGNSGEIDAAAILRGEGLRVYRAVEGLQTDDLMTFGDVEVKRDCKAERSGRLAIEVTYRDRPSGLTTTTAGQWLFLTDLRAILVSTAALRGLVNSGIGKCVRGGDFKYAQIELLPIAAVERVALFSRILRSDK